MSARVGPAIAMANPQPEPFVQFSKELYRAILRAPFGGCQQAIVLAVVFQTYGHYGRKSAPISVGTLSELTGRDRAQVSRALALLINEGVIKRISAGRIDHTAQRLSLNKNYERWGRFSVEPQTVDMESTVDTNSTVDTESTELLIPCQQNCCDDVNRTVDTMSTIEEIDIETIEDPPICPPTPIADRFDTFWARWPNKHGSKKLAKQRFAALSAKAQRDVLTAEDHFIEALDDGRYDPEYQPRAENFIGGSKAYYREWVAGPPRKYATMRLDTHRKDAAAVMADAVAGGLSLEDFR